VYASLGRFAASKDQALHTSRLTQFAQDESIEADRQHLVGVDVAAEEVRLAQVGKDQSIENVRLQSVKDDSTAEPSCRTTVVEDRRLEEFRLLGAASDGVESSVKGHAVVLPRPAKRKTSDDSDEQMDEDKEKDVLPYKKIHSRPFVDEQKLSEYLHGLEMYCRRRHIFVRFFVTDTLCAWLEQEYRSYIGGKKSNTLSWTDHATIHEAFLSFHWAAGDVAALGDCGYDSSKVCLAALGIERPNLRAELMDAIVAAFHETNEGLGPIFAEIGKCKELSFLETFQNVATFEGIYERDLTDAQRAAKVAKKNKDRAKYLAHPDKMDVYNAKKAAHEANKKGQFTLKKPVEPVNPDAPEVNDLVTKECQHGDATHQKACNQFYDYIKVGRRDTTWLDAFCVMYLPRVLGRPVHVYSLEWRTWQKYEPLDEEQRGQEPICLLLNVKHYAPLVKCSRSGI
jgi:hypothetical protein